MGGTGSAAGGPSRAQVLGIAVAAVVVAVVWYGVYRQSLAAVLGTMATPYALVHLLGTAVLTGAGVTTWVRRPPSYIGPMLLVAAFADHIGALQMFAVERAFVSKWTPVDVANWLGGLPFVIFFHAALTFPSGRAPGPIERALVWTGYILVVGLGWLLPTPLFRWVTWPGLAVMGMAVAVGVVRYVRASPAGRRVIGPVPVAVLALTFVALAYAALWGLEGQTEQALQAAKVVQAVTSPIVGVAFMASLLRTRLARADVGDLVLSLQGRPGPDGLVEALRRALRDPSVDVAFWLPERGRYVDSAGSELEEASPAPGRAAITVRDEGGGPLAVVAYDAALDEEGELIEAVIAAARLALENARLQAALRLQLVEVAASRRRIVAAADAERRRVERDLHDGAQQHLVGLSLLLQTARAQAAADSGLRETLEAAAEHLRIGLHELRELARGIHPTVLSQSGLAGAVASLADRAPLPVDVVAVPTERFDAVVELTAYFVLAEATTNIVKHASASAASIAVRYSEGSLDLEVADDGVGGAQLSRGGGLEGLADRVTALGGHLSVSPGQPAGTRVQARLPAVVVGD